MGCTRFVHSGCTRLAFQRGKGYDHTLIVDLRAPDLWEQAGTKSIAASEDSRAQLRYGLIMPTRPFCKHANGSAAQRATAKNASIHAPFLICSPRSPEQVSARPGKTN
jgi:hypothetical protein